MSTHSLNSLKKYGRIIFQFILHKQKNLKYLMLYYTTFSCH